MKKLFSLLLITILLTNMFSPVFGSDYHQTALTYLTEKYDISDEQIELFEGGIQEFEFIAESFWHARYTIYPEGQSSASSNNEPLSTEPMILPADIDPEARQEIMPIRPEDDDNLVYGGIYIRIKTGEILEDGQMESYYSAERKLAQQEWERLSKEAGKLDVSLFLKMQELSATEKVTVWIQPRAVESEDLQAQFTTLKSKFPDFTVNLALSDVLSHGTAVPLPLRGAGISSFEGAPDQAGTREDEVTSYVAPSSKAATDLPKNSDTAMIPTEPSEEYLQEQSAFWEELEQIRLQAITPSLHIIKDALDSMAISFQDKETTVTAEMTVAQINEIAQLSAVSTIYEEAIFSTMDQDMLRSSSDDASTLAMEADNNKSNNAYLPVLLIIAAMAVLSWIIYFRKKVIRS